VVTVHDQLGHMRKQLETIQTVQGQHEIRFANGMHVMAEMKADIAMLKPKAPDWVKVTMSLLAVIGILMGAQLWMTDRFAERPRWDQVDGIVKPVKDAQDRTSRSVHEIEASQLAQEQSIKAILRAQELQGTKLDKALTQRGRKR
jgi:hypothetical protein